MNNVLVDALPEEWNGYAVNTDFTIGIQMMQAQYDNAIAGFEKTDSLMYLLFADEDGSLREHPEGEEFVKCVNWFLNGWFHDRPDARKDKIRNVDYDVDQWRIYADFLQVYGIDLSSTDMHWWKFCGLLWNMPYRQSAFQQVVYARTAVPDRNSGAEERKRIRENKKKYALEQLNEPKEYTAEEKSAIDAYDRMMAERRK